MMNHFLRTSTLIISFCLLLTFGARAQSHNILVTKYEEHITGLKKLGEVTASSSKLLGGELKLRTDATEILKSEALKLGGTVVFLEADNFNTTDVNTVTLTGAVYGQDNLTTEELISSPLPEQSVSEVIITDNPLDAKGLKRFDDIGVSSSNVFSGEAKLTEAAKEKLKKEAKAKGCRVVLIQYMNFSTTPMNTVTITGTGYR